ncbi:predicted protein [Histoplasma capsulatum var. duboisii H88]|uniref:Predicted protein n=1 Tax=Ajellomyces capsulatus (strain H88) TaxID=544711 RepID=F0UQN6_AJEC8|nr:predicted protein [Histoplasma capsulatum var. duboisii H88]
MTKHGLVGGEDGRRKGRKEENRKLDRIEKITHTGTEGCTQCLLLVKDVGSSVPSYRRIRSINSTPKALLALTVAHSSRRKAAAVSRVSKSTSRLDRYRFDQLRIDRRTAPKVVKGNKSVYVY